MRVYEYLLHSAALRSFESHLSRLLNGFISLLSASRRLLSLRSPGLRSGGGQARGRRLQRLGALASSLRGRAGMEPGPPARAGGSSAAEPQGSGCASRRGAGSASLNESPWLRVSFRRPCPRPVTTQHRAARSAASFLRPASLQIVLG